MHISNLTADSTLQNLFPMYGRDTRRGICTLNPGDMFYMPGCYFHEVNSKGRHLGINFWTSLRKNLEKRNGAPPVARYSEESGLTVSKH